MDHRPQVREILTAVKHQVTAVAYLTTFDPSSFGLNGCTVLARATFDGVEFGVASIRRRGLHRSL